MRTMRGILIKAGNAMAAHRFHCLRPAAAAEVTGKKARIRKMSVKSTRKGIATAAKAKIGAKQRDWRVSKMQV